MKAWNLTRKSAFFPLFKMATFSCMMPSQLKDKVGREVLTSYFIKTSPILPNLLFQILSNPPPSLLPPTPTPTGHYVVLFIWLNGWLHHTWCAILLNVIMDVHMSSLMALILMLVLCNKASDFIVCIGLSTPPTKTQPPPPFFTKPYLPSVLIFRKPPIRLDFPVNTHNFHP